MTTLIIGGSGLIGSRLVNYLITNDDEECVILDMTKPHTTHDKLKFIPITIPISHSIRNTVMSVKPERIVYLAEVARIDSPYSHINIEYNVDSTASLFETCSRVYKIGQPVATRIIIGTWLERLESNDTLTASLNWRKQLIEYYNRGNIAITPIQIPRIIDFNMPSSMFGSIISRLYDSIHTQRPLICREDEYIGTEGQYPIGWTTVDHVVDSIYSKLTGTRTRLLSSPIHVVMTNKHAIGHALDVFDTDATMIHMQRHDPIIVERIQGDEDEHIRRFKLWVKREFIDSESRDTFRDGDDSLEE